jgi:hypothetical protein
LTQAWKRRRPFASNEATASAPPLDRTPSTSVASLTTPAPYLPTSPGIFRRLGMMRLIARILRWVLILPAAIAAMLAVQLACGLVAYVLGDDFPLNLVGTRFIGEWMASFSASAAFVGAGTWMAPSQVGRFVVSWLLAAISVLCAVWSIYHVVTLPGFSLGATVIWPLPFGLRQHTSPAWWQLLMDMTWGLSAMGAAVGYQDN